MTAQPIPAMSVVQSVAIDEKQWQTLMSDTLTHLAPFMGTHTRRREDRHHLRNVMQMFVGIGVRNPQRFLVRTRNISRHGVGFIHSRPVRRGMRCSLALLRHDQRLVHLKATIASSRSRPDGHYDVGVTFDKPIYLSDFLGAGIAPVSPPRQAVTCHVVSS